MSNPLFQLLNQNDILSRFEIFRNSFNGDPQEQVKRMLDTGQMSQEQFNQIAKQATTLRKMLPK